MKQDGKVVALTVSCRDITELRSLEKAVVEVAERQRRELAFNLHDDLGQHLAGLQMVIDVNGHVSGPSRCLSTSPLRACVGSLFLPVLADSIARAEITAELLVPSAIPC